MSQSDRPEVWTAARNFSGGRKPTVETPTLVLYHWEQCGHCKALRPEWDRLLSVVHTDTQWNQLATRDPQKYALRLAEIEAGEMQKVTDAYGKNFFTEYVYDDDNAQTVSQRKVRGFPELRLYLPQGPAAYVYNGSRTAPEIAQWVKGILTTGGGQSGGATVTTPMCYQRRRNRTASTSNSEQRRRRRRSSSLYKPSHVVAARLAQGGTSSVRRVTRQRRKRSRSRKRGSSRS